MTTNFLRSALAAGLALYLAAGPGLVTAAVPAIGTVVTSGAFRLNHATVRSNGTLFEGALVETGPAQARMDLSNGTRLELEPESAGRVFGGRLVLERGATQIYKKTAGFGGAAASGSGLATGFLVQARGLTIQPGAGAATGRVTLIGTGRVEVSASTGSFQVLNPEGVLVAKLAAGKALALESQSTPGPARLTGRLETRGGHYLLTDETTNVAVEVAGSVLTEADLARALGQRVEIKGSARTGATPVNGAAQLIEVAQVTPAPLASGSAPAGSTPAGPGGSGGTAPAGAGGAGGAAGGAAGTAAVSVTMIAIIGGVAAAAVVGGLAASGSLGGSAAAPVSR